MLQSSNKQTLSLTSYAELKKLRKVHQKFVVFFELLTFTLEGIGKFKQTDPKPDKLDLMDAWPAARAGQGPIIWLHGAR